MNKIHLHINDLAPKYWLAMLLLCIAGAGHAGEAAVDPSDAGADVIEDLTEDPDSRSSEVSAETEELIDPVLMHDSDVPLADAVSEAGKRAEPLELLGGKVKPGTSKRLSWSATELFEGVPVSTPVLVINGALPGPSLSHS